MQLLDQHRLGHIIEYCHRIQATITRFGNSYEAFSADEDYQQSIAFSILQIGELVAGLSDEYKESTNGKMPWQAIKAMRNIVAHGYGNIELAVVWRTALEDIPDLQAFCKEELRSSQNDIAGDPFYSEANLRWIRKSVAQAEAGQLETHELVEEEDE